MVVRHRSIAAAAVGCRAEYICCARTAVTSVRTNAVTSRATAMETEESDGCAMGITGAEGRMTPSCVISAEQDRYFGYPSDFMRAVDVIRKKRDGEALDRQDIDSFIAGATDGSWPDYQITALLMAIVLRGMTDEETAWLTGAMARSGSRFD